MMDIKGKPVHKVIPKMELSGDIIKELPALEEQTNRKPVECENPIFEETKKQDLSPQKSIDAVNMQTVNSLEPPYAEIEVPMQSGRL